jgi:cytochrome c oxidase subunit 2
MRRLLARAALASSAAAIASQAWAAEKLGQPTDGAIGLQQAASPMKVEATNFNNYVLLPIIIFVAAFVLLLLLIVVIRFNKRANPTPARWSHNTPIEVLWTLVPVLILVVIAVPSFRLLFDYANPPPAYMTVKVTGYQWYWGYAYPDQKIPEIISNELPEEKAGKQLFRLAVDNPLVVPVNRVVKVVVTGSDVIHDFALPAFGLKTDAIPGRLNQTWFKATKIGTYYGQCSELCGVNHAFMPIQINVVSDADFAAYVAAHHGTMPGAAAPVLAQAAAIPSAAAITTSAPSGAVTTSAPSGAVTTSAPSGAVTPSAPSGATQPASGAPAAPKSN